MFGVMALFELSIFVKSIIYFNVSHYSRSINKEINTKLGMLAHHDKCAVARHSENNIFELRPFLTKHFKLE